MGDCFDKTNLPSDMNISKKLKEELKWIVDESNGIYHWNDKCERMSTSTYAAKGYEFCDKGLVLCDYCKEEMDEYEPEPIRRP